MEKKIFLLLFLGFVGGLEASQPHVAKRKPAEPLELVVKNEAASSYEQQIAWDDEHKLNTPVQKRARLESDIPVQEKYTPSHIAISYLSVAELRARFPQVYEKMAAEYPALFTNEQLGMFMVGSSKHYRDFKSDLNLDCLRAACNPMYFEKMLADVERSAQGQRDYAYATLKELLKKKGAVDPFVLDVEEK